MFNPKLYLKKNPPFQVKHRFDLVYFQAQKCVTTYSTNPSMIHVTFLEIYIDASDRKFTQLWKRVIKMAALTFDNFLMQSKKNKSGFLTERKGSR